LFEILDAPLPSEIARERQDTPSRREDTPTRRQATPRPRPAERPQPEPIPAEPREQVPYGAPKSVRRRRRARPGGIRRVRRRIKHIDPISVLKVSLLFYAFFLIIWLIVVALAYRTLDGMGLFDQLQSLGEDLVLPSLRNEITLGQVERWALVVGILGVVVGSFVNAFLAFLYNLISDFIGGIEVTFQEREAP
jgi:hypothetical protein